MADETSRPPKRAARPKQDAAPPRARRAADPGGTTKPKATGGSAAGKPRASSGAAAARAGGAKAAAGTSGTRRAPRTTVNPNARSGAKPKGATPAGKGGKRAGGRRRSVWGRIVRGGLIIGLVLILMGTVAGYAFYQQAELPEANADFGTQTTRLYFRDGTTQLGQLAVQNRTVIPFAEMPQSVKDAVVAAEDRTFWTNRGIDVRGMTRALWRIARGGDVQGGSTITQQYIKIRYLTSDQTMSRKLTELALAIKMNKAASKETVLEGYLNTVYFGRGAYGIQAAAQAFFKVDAKDLNVGQAAALASILNSPSMYDPANGPEAQQALLERYNYVLDGMLDPMQTITAAQHDQFYNQLPEFPEYQVDNVYGGPNGFLIQMATDELKAQGFTETQINGGGLSIVTTFDARMQQAAIDASQSVVAEAAANANPLRDAEGNLLRDANGNTVQPDPAGLHVGLASIEVGTGAVLALYGGADYVTSSQNWATTPRYAASTFKIWGATAGLRNGFGLRSTLRGNTYTPEGDNVPVQNDSGYQYGTVTLLKAIQDSINTSFVDLVSRIPNGNSEVVRAAKDAGIPEHPSWAPQGNRLVLGEGEVSSLANASAFATLANNGVRNQTHVVAEVRDASGNVIYTGNAEGVQAIEDPVARDLTYAMSGAVSGSTVNAVGGRDVAGKTGTEGIAVGQQGTSGEATEQITRAGLLVGYTKQIATSVLMVAGDSGNENLDVYARPGSGAFYGAGYPTEVWNRYMQVAVEGMPFVNFDPPANIRPTVQDTLPVSTPPPTTATSSAPPTTTEAPPPTTTEAPPPTTTEAPPPSTTTPTPSATPPPGLGTPPLGTDLLPPGRGNGTPG